MTPEKEALVKVLRENGFDPDNIVKIELDSGYFTITRFVLDENGNRLRLGDVPHASFKAGLEEMPLLIQEQRVITY